MRSFIQLSDLIVLACVTFIMVRDTNALPQDTSPPRIYRRGDLPTAPPPYDPDNDNIVRYVSKRCSTDQLASEARGWAEAGVLANALHAWKPTSDYQSAMDTYMGTDSSSNWGLFWSYRQRVQNAVNNGFKIHHGEQPSRTYIYVYCDEDETPKEYGKLCGGDTGAYTWDSLGWIWSNHMLVLCPNNYFDDKKTSSLSTQLRKIRDDPSKAKDMYSLYWNLGSVYFHETFHWGNTVTNPRAMDYDPDDHAKSVYGPISVKDEAAAKNTYANSVIADAYTMVGTAMMLMQTFKLGDSPQPLSASTAKVYNVPALGDAPKGWIGPQDVNDPNSQPDMSKWQRAVKVAIDMGDYEPVSDAGGASKPPTPPPSKPICGANGYTAPYADVENVNRQLDAKGGQQCCTTHDGGCTNVGESGKIAVDLCSNPGQLLCVDCARLANYVAGIEHDCQKGNAPNIMVGGTQDIVETPGLKVEI